MDEIETTGLEKRFCLHRRTMHDLMRLVEHNAATGNHGGLPVSINQLAARIAVNVLQSDQAKDLIRAVIADEAAKSDPQPVAAGDVPEWPDTLTVQGVVWIPRERAESELSRRVAEVTADRDRWIERVGEHAAAMKVIAIERDALRQQLAAAQAEVVTKEGHIERLMDEKHIMQIQVDSLRAEVSRLTRPVDSVTCGAAATFNQELWVVAFEDFQREQNARESAERERDELREFVKAWYAEATPNCFFSRSRMNPLSDTQLANALAAYRAEKGKAQA